MVAGPTSCRELFGLIGRRLGHSFSATFFNRYFEGHGVDACYRLFELEDIAEFPALVDSLPSLVGLNVTIPYKEEVIPYLNRLSDEARAVGAVNVVSFRRDSDGSPLLCGHNSDVYGFRRALLEFCDDKLPSRALVLGSGGASKAVGYVLASLRVAVTTVSRKPSRPGQVSYEDITPELWNDCGLIVNTTPLGMYPDTDTAPPLPWHLGGEGKMLFDLVYNPDVTRLMREASEAGAKACNGLAMLRYQALEAYKIWRSDH